MNILFGGASNAKALGAFYTPSDVARELANWVVRDGTERLLEPSVGEGALMLASIARARSLKERSATISFVACDINPLATAAISPMLSPACEAKTIDFLALDPNETGAFDGVIANPPFTRNHDLPKPIRAALRKRFEITGAAGLWVHFLLHSLSFLSPGGRLGAVIPASGLFSLYGREALARIASAFSHIEVRQIVDEPGWTNGAEERGALLFAEGYRMGSCELPVPTQWSADGRAQRAAVSDSIYDEILHHSAPLSAIAELSIGAVTGYNAVFLLSENERCSRGIDLREVRPVVGRARHIAGIEIDADELASLAKQGQKTWLLKPESIDVRGDGVRNQLAMISKSRRQGTLWFKKRSPWWDVQLGEPCDAIFTYMNDQGPKLVLARDAIYCTNTLHRVRFRDGVDQECRTAAALTMISTFGQLAAERLGRSYGGGVLKLELGEARSMPVLHCSSGRLHETFKLVNLALRGGQRDQARKLADEVLLRPILGGRFHEVMSTLKEELTSRRFQRRRKVCS
ncbi:N-6 DNA methylase [Rhizobium leguminosarum]|uniref:N-6 DNA methylase n=1 Tax=Rhizobium leguminosarum TaxID=384 RepID=UPI003F952F2D